MHKFYYILMDRLCKIKSMNCRYKISYALHLTQSCIWLSHYCEIILQCKKKISFMLLIIDKCLMAIELSPKGRNPNITPQQRTLLKRGRIILVVVCKRTFLDWVVWFRNYGTITFVIFRGGGLKINLEDI
jgi:hypothetical protein